MISLFRQHLQARFHGVVRVECCWLVHHMGTSGHHNTTRAAVHNVLQWPEAKHTVHACI